WMIAIARLLRQLEDQVVRLVRGFADLLQHNPLFALDLGRRMIRREDQRQHCLQHLGRVLAEAADEIAGAFVFRRRIDRCAARLDCFSDLAGAQASGALERHMLQEVGQSVALGRLEAGAGAEKDPNGGGAQTGHRVQDNANAVSERDNFACLCHPACATMASMRLRTKSASIGPVSNFSLREANFAARSGRSTRTPRAFSTVSGNFAACAVARVTTGPSAIGFRRAAASPTAVWGQTIQPVSA